MDGAWTVRTFPGGHGFKKGRVLVKNGIEKIVIGSKKTGIERGLQGSKVATPRRVSVPSPLPRSKNPLLASQSGEKGDCASFKEDCTSFKEDWTSFENQGLPRPPPWERDREPGIS